MCFVTKNKEVHLVCKKSAPQQSLFSDEPVCNQTFPLCFSQPDVGAASNLRPSVTAQMRSLLCLCFLSLRLLGFSKRLHFAKSQWLPIGPCHDQFHFWWRLDPIAVTRAHPTFWRWLSVAHWLGIVIASTQKLTAFLFNFLNFFLRQTLRFCIVNFCPCSGLPQLVPVPQWWWSFVQLCGSLVRPARNVPPTKGAPEHVSLNTVFEVVLAAEQSEHNLLPIVHGRSLVGSQAHPPVPAVDLRRPGTFHNSLHVVIKMVRNLDTTRNLHTVVS